MSFWSENYSFIKDVYDTRVSKMIEWMDHVEMAIQKGMMTMAVMVMVMMMVMMMMDHIETAIQKVTTMLLKKRKGQGWKISNM